MHIYAIFAFIFVFLTSNSLADELPKIKIGAVLPLSGPAQSYGQEARLALEHALSDSQAKKFQYELYFEDDKVQPAQALTAAQKLITQDNIDVIFSNWSYGGLAVASAAKGKPLTHFAFAWDPAVIKLANNSFIIAPPPSLIAETIVQELKNQAVKSLVLVQYEESGIEHALDELEKLASIAGIKVLRRFRMNPEDFQVLKSVAAQIKQLQPDYISGSLLLPQYVELFKNLKNLNYSARVASIGQTPESSDLKNVIPNIWWSVDYSANPNQLKLIQERTALKDLSGYTAFYDSLRAIIEIYESYEKNKKPEANWLQDQLKKYQRTETFLGSMYFKDQIRQSDNINFVDQAAKYEQ